MPEEDSQSDVSQGTMTLSIVTPCFNEEANLIELIERIRRVMADVCLEYEHILIDNSSTDVYTPHVTMQQEHRLV